MRRIGIDLGTTNSVMAWSKDGRNPSIITSRENERRVPSVVGRHPRQGTLLVGQTAITFAPGDPRNTIFSVKRLMGRRFEDKEVENVKRHVAYRIVPPEAGGSASMAQVMIGDKTYSPIEVSSFILQKIKNDAEAALGETVTHAVITVPAYFDDIQKEATRQAGGLAGLRVSRIVEEPTAAAYAFGMDLDPSEAKTILVYDLGGGTFDVSIIFVSEGIPTVENTEGHHWLGGDNFDNHIINYVLAKVEQQHRISQDDMRADPEFMWAIKHAAEKAKKNLGQAPSTDIVLFGAMRRTIDVEVTISRTDFENWIRPEIDESMRLVKVAMQAPGFTAADIDHVLLVGGSTAIPLVRRLLIQTFGEEKIRSTIDPMEGVALGAAILASRTERKFCIRGHANEPNVSTCETPGCTLDISDVEAKVICNHCGELHDKQTVICPKSQQPLIVEAGGVTAKPYGKDAPDGGYDIILPKGTRYPTMDPIYRPFRTPSDNAEWIVFSVYQGIENQAMQNELQGRIIIPDPEDGPIPAEKRVPRGTPLDIGFSLDESGILTVKVRGKGALDWLHVDRVVRPWENQPDGNGEETQAASAVCSHCKHVNSSKAAICEECGHGLQEEPPGDWKRDLSFEVRMLRVAVQDYDWRLDRGQVQVLQSLIDRSRHSLEINDEASGRLLKSEIDNAMGTICHSLLDLIEASFIYHSGVGDADQNHRLGAMLLDYKQRVMRGESPYDAVLQDLRNRQIENLVSEIVGKLGDRDRVNCQKCSNLRPRPSHANPNCPHCGYNPYTPEA